MDVATLSPAQSGSVPNDRWLQALEEGIARTRAGADSEAVHELRVASARLRVWAELAGRDDLDGPLAALRDAAAALRDVDVQLTGEPPARWARALAKRRTVAHAELVCALAAPSLQDLLRSLRAAPPAPRRAAEHALRHLARRTLRIRPRPRSLRALHRLRRRVRRLRYACDWLALDATKLAHLQDLLGDACDAFVAAHAMRKEKHASVRRRRAKLVEDGKRRGREAVHAWHATRAAVEALARDPDAVGERRADR